MKPCHWRPETLNLVIEVSEDIERNAEILYSSKQSTTFDYEEICKESFTIGKLSPDQTTELKSIITRNREVFFSDPWTTHSMRMDIELISEKPIKILSTVLHQQSSGASL
ncbi:hypothetical protein TNCV_3262971 [Trichonephila clavipes]|nr:hypothetical protein TNCV_3262971 [Trichonephila clavipes]